MISAALQVAADAALGGRAVFGPGPPGQGRVASSSSRREGGEIGGLHRRWPRPRPPGRLRRGRRAPHRPWLPGGGRRRRPDRRRGRRGTSPRWRRRARASAGPSSRSTPPGPTARMSATVRTSSMRRRSGFSTMRGEGSDGARVGRRRASGRSRSSPGGARPARRPARSRSRSRPRRSQAARAARAPAFSWPPTPPLPVSCSSMARNSASPSSISGHMAADRGWSPAQRAAGDVGDDAHRPQRVLVDGVGVVHVELHLGDDAAELGDEAAQHAGLVHQGQGAVGLPAARPGRPGKPWPPPGRAAPWR